MSFRDTIERKRDGHSLTVAEIEAFVTGVVNGSLPDYQIAAFLMAVVWRGMTPVEVTELARAMIGSGPSVTLDHLGTPAVDKHSTGGVGDKTSLIVAPLVAAAGVPVPMLSGRALGHTGGTLDKIESIPGFRADLTVAEFRQISAEVGLAIMAQSREMAPADRKLYALRDVTATVESLPLIVASILSKKFASGVRSLVFDVKCGRGAFVRTRTEARALARALVSTTRELGGRAVALVTGMDQPLGQSVGNALEVRESIRALGGEVAPDLREVVQALGAEMLMLGGVTESAEEARRELLARWESGDGSRKFRQLVAIQGGDGRVVERPDLLPHAREVVSLTAEKQGWVTGLDALEVGRLVRDLGAGREKVGDRVNPAVGIVFHKRMGDRVSRGDLLADIHVDDRQAAATAPARLEAAYVIGPRRVRVPSPVFDRIA